MSKQRLKVTIEACCETCKMLGFALCHSVSTNPCGGYVPQVFYLQSKIDEAKRKMIRETNHAEETNPVGI